MMRNKRLDRKKVSCLLTLILSLSMIVSSVFSVNVLVADDDQTQEGEEQLFADILDLKCVDEHC